MSTLPADVKLEAYRGDTWSQTFRLRFGESPVDLTGATVEAQARRDGVPEPVALTVDVTDPVDGLIVLSMTPGSLTPGVWAYDVEVTLGGAVTTWVRGRLQVYRDVTNELPKVSG